MASPSLKCPLEGDDSREPDNGAGGGKEPTGGAGRPIPATWLLDTEPHSSSGALLWASPTPAAPVLPLAPFPAVPATALCHLCGEPRVVGRRRDKGKRTEGSEHGLGQSEMKLSLAAEFLGQRVSGELDL